LNGELSLANVDDIHRDYMYCGGTLNVNGIDSNKLHSFIGTNPIVSICVKIYVDDVLTKTDTRAVTNTTYNILSGKTSVTDNKIVKIIYTVSVSGTN
jgi:hypothetical protein